jgi:lipopolysaccharide assembly protein A
MSIDPQSAPQGASLPRQAPGTEAPPMAEVPVLPGAVYPAEETIAPGLAEPEPAAIPGPPAPAEPAPQAPPLKIKRTRTSGLWVAVGFFAVILLLLLIFILQNGTQVSVNYLGAHGHLPLGVALLLSAVCGVLLVVLAGAARISQLRTVARRHRRADTRRSKAAARQQATR